MGLAVGSENVSRIVGYKITKGNFNTSSPNLPQRIAIIGEANEANQSNLVTTPVKITSAKQAGDLYGYGSPIHSAMRILRPISGDGVGGIETVVYAQAKASGAAAKVLTLTVTGTATSNGTHTLVIAGRKGIDGLFYDVNIVTGDTPTMVAAKIEDAINAILASPLTAAHSAGVVTTTSKWNGLTANELSITVDTGTNTCGLTYAVVSTTSGSGTPSIAASLALFANEWNTIVLNTYGTASTIISSLEQFNGIPDPDAPTGRFAGIIMKPFIALTGSVAEDPSSVTDALKNNVTIAICPAPLSKGFHWEAAANMTLLFARQAQDTPELDVSGKNYPDMPAPLAIGLMASYTDRDAIVKKGCSTVELSAGVYKVMDFVTSYHPDGEVVPQFRYCRNLMIDWNIRFKYMLLELVHVIDHLIAKDTDTVTAPKVVKPKMWKQVLSTFAEDLTAQGIVVDTEFMQKSVTVDISTTNPDRLETFFRYKRSGYARIASTTAEAGFNFGTN